LFILLCSVAPTVIAFVLDMGNIGRQAAAGKRLASLQQPVSVERASNVQIGNTSDRPTGETDDDTHMPARSEAYTLRYKKPKQRRTTPIHAKAKGPATQLDTGTPATPPLEEPSEPANLRQDDEKNMEVRSSKITRQTGTRDHYETHDDEEDEDRTMSLSAINLRRTQLANAKKALESLNEGAFRPGTISKDQSRRVSSERCGSDVAQTTDGIEPRLLDVQYGFAANSPFHGGNAASAKPIASPTRVPKFIRVRKRTPAVRRESSGAKTVALQAAELCRTSEDEEYAQTGRVDGAELDGGEDVGAGSLLSPTTPSARASQQCNDRDSKSVPAAEKSRSRQEAGAASRNFKAKKFRGKFDRATLEKGFGVVLSEESAQILQDLSGNDMASAVNLYLQGYCNTPETRSDPIVPEPIEAPSRRERAHESGDSTSSITFWQQRRHSGHERRPSHVAKTPIEALQHPSQMDDGHLEIVSSDKEPREIDCDADRGEDSGDLNHGLQNALQATTEADVENDTLGTGPVPLRGMQGFTNQENVRPRNAPSNTNRLPNGKLGESRFIRHKTSTVQKLMHSLTR
jgi:hypothetical protein